MQSAELTAFTAHMHQLWFLAGMSKTGPGGLGAEPGPGTAVPTEIRGRQCWDPSYTVLTAASFIGGHKGAACWVLCEVLERLFEFLPRSFFFFFNPYNINKVLLQSNPFH